MFLPLGSRWCAIEKQDVRGQNEVTWLKLLQGCEMDVLPPTQLVHSIAQWTIPGSRLEVLPVLFLRLTWKACVAVQYQSNCLEDFIKSELIPLAQWFFGSQAYKRVSDSQMRAGWNSRYRSRKSSKFNKAVD